MKLYISGPMTGMPDNNRENFELAAKLLRARGHEVLSPIEFDPEEALEGDGYNASDEEYEGYLARDLNMIMSDPELDGVAFIHGWPRSGGAGREGRAALEKGKRLWMVDMGSGALIVLPDWLFLQYSTTERRRPPEVRA